MVTAYAGSSDLVGQALVAETMTGPALPLAPVHVRAVRDGTGEIVLRWTRRSRAEDDSWGAAEAALELVPERYLVSIFNGETLKRTLEVGGPEARYGVAEQSADFGGLAAGFGYSVAQISAALGAGHRAEGRYGD